MNQIPADELFDADGRLVLDRLADDARAVLESARASLVSKGRQMFLPLDLMIALIDRGHEELAQVVADGTEGSVVPDDVSARLKALADEIEEGRSGEPPEFSRLSFSRGFTRILIESLEYSPQESAQITEDILVRHLIWRAEAVESASVRWAIRRLGEGGGDILFDEKGLLRQDVFQDSMWSILQGSMQIASAHGTPFLGTPHLIAMVCSVKNSTVWRGARARGLEPGRLREELLRLIGSKPKSIPDFHIGRKTLTPRMVRMLSIASRHADSELVGEHEIVEAFLEDGGSSLELIQALGLESELRKALGEPMVLEEAFSVEAAIRLGARKQSTPTLDLLGRDLTADALEGRLPEIVGREMELQRVVNVLLRKEQRNPLLTGEAGVGKTALAVALAQRIASGKVPKSLLGHRLVEINGASLMGGTSYRGDLESRIKSLLEEASDDVILFIDEAHAVFAPRSGSHSPAEVPNHFKSALASGRIAVVGATTEAEYRRWFEQDPALKRRFERIEVGEPSVELVRAILEGLVEEMEQDYDVKVDPDAVDAAIDLSVRYLPEQRLPDKAKKLLMDACIAEANNLGGSSRGDRCVARAGIANQVHLKTGIPTERLMRGEMTWWDGFEARVQEQVVGQDAAVTQVARALVTGRLKRARGSRPMAVLVFVGPPGVGKGTLAGALAREVFSDRSALLRLDMTDFQESHSMSRLVGSPPGYVGYEDEDMLVTPLRRRPSSVVLLEDLDRAHPRIQDRLLRLMSEGAITDTRGYTADVSNAIFVITVNTAAAQNLAKIGFGKTESVPHGSRVLESHDASFANRIREYVDEVIAFDGLDSGGAKPARELVRRRLESFVNAMRSEYMIEVVIDAQLQHHLEVCAESLSGAQAIHELVDDMLFDPVTDTLLAGHASEEIQLSWNLEEERVCVKS